MDETIIRFIRLPLSTKGFVVDAPDGTHNIYINDRLGFEMQRKTFLHELRHIKKGHLVRDISAEDAEQEAF